MIIKIDQFKLEKIIFLSMSSTIESFFPSPAILRFLTNFKFSIDLLLITYYLFNHSSC